MKRIFVALMAFSSMVLFAQASGSLSPSESLPALDGAVADGEYQFTTTASGMDIGATLGTDGNLYLSIRAKTAGWVALGVGGRAMSGSRLFIAYDTGDKQFFTEQRGVGHFHSDVKDQVVSKWAVKKVDGTTTLELVLPASAAVANGNLDILYAYAESTAFMHHKARGSLSLSVQS
jgi:hypothetical protein